MGNSIAEQKAALTREYTSKAGELIRELDFLCPTVAEIEVAIGWKTNHPKAAELPRLKARLEILPNVIALLRRKAAFHLAEMNDALFTDRSSLTGFLKHNPEGRAATLAKARQEMQIAHQAFVVAATEEHRAAIADVIGLLDVEAEKN